MFDLVQIQTREFVIKIYIITPENTSWVNRNYFHDYYFAGAQTYLFPDLNGKEENNLQQNGGDY